MGLGESSIKALSSALTRKQGDQESALSRIQEHNRTVKKTNEAIVGFVNQSNESQAWLEQGQDWLANYTSQYNAAADGKRLSNEELGKIFADYAKLETQLGQQNGKLNADEQELANLWADATKNPFLKEYCNIGVFEIDNAGMCMMGMGMGSFNYNTGFKLSGKELLAVSSVLTDKLKSADCVAKELKSLGVCADSDGKEVTLGSGKKISDANGDGGLSNADYDFSKALCKFNEDLCKFNGEVEKVENKIAVDKGDIASTEGAIVINKAEEAAEQGVNDRYAAEEEAAAGLMEYQESINEGYENTINEIGEVVGELEVEVDEETKVIGELQDEVKDAEDEIQDAQEKIAEAKEEAEEAKLAEGEHADADETTVVAGGSHEMPAVETISGETPAVEIAKNDEQSVAPPVDESETVVASASADRDDLYIDEQALV